MPRLVNSTRCSTVLWDGLKSNLFPKIVFPLLRRRSCKCNIECDRFIFGLFWFIGFLLSFNSLFSIFFIVTTCNSHIAGQAEGAWEPSVKTFRSHKDTFVSTALSAVFWRHCVLSSETQRRSLPHYQT